MYRLEKMIDLAVEPVWHVSLYPEMDILDESQLRELIVFCFIVRVINYFG